MCCFDCKASVVLFTGSGLPVRTSVEECCVFFVALCYLFRLTIDESALQITEAVKNSLGTKRSVCVSSDLIRYTTCG